MSLTPDDGNAVRRRRWGLDRCALLRGLPPTLLEHIARHSTELNLDEGDALFFKNDPSDFLAFVVHGRIYKLLYGPDGQELIVDTIESGETVDETPLLDTHSHTFTAVAYTATRVLLLSRRHFPSLTCDPGVIERAHVSLCLRLRHAVESLETMCLHRLESRLARYLLSLMHNQSRPREGDFEVALPPTQSILAAMVNASRPKLNAQLQTWHRSGLVSRKRNILRINDIDQFRCKAYLGRDAERPDQRARSTAARRSA
ncbi:MULTISPECIES: Crp/Fnr family transcriptional regulator [unclassified Lysobacter]|uniref:Crp/Fnr family transcriptional regulator n=1 Tax=unclassified Lysobacter TaxID=2635362 RepID=UPI001BE5D5BF|nr:MULTISPECIES: Crp/Fnr family transcriptional regulator [unclassified Lysobacter]MBT2748491.1 Crp/Fnr family transcriptional regulator [Lysobacter sp. ISL-42]MBT2752579.1 Crp/Fnr family transcriptional regulator [Lysobacter sp. ISL-50]MBT2776692.1 Crp/Fnr family transcriptional regulator [Lysobacter sp. ISL-54]MBT2782563.1 Crp/Fnr family transcriptional regulator [Lysobacter sp. ISL-52]